MHFAYPLPWWAIGLLAAVAVLAGLATYGVAGRRARLVPAALRSAALLLLLLVLFRPLASAAPRNPNGTILPILVDQSRSMRIAGTDGRRRIDVAADLLRRTLLPRLSGRFEPQIFGFGDVLSSGAADHLSSADEKRTNLGAALRAIGDRFRDRPLAGVIVVSDGGSTDELPASPLLTAPVFTVGVGGVPPDREVASLVSSNSTLAGSLVDLDAAVMSRGFGTESFDVRLVASRADSAGASRTTVDVRRVTASDGVAVPVRFSVPVPAAATVYSVEIAGDSRDMVPENDSASVLVPSPGRKRRILFVEGTPGFEHSFVRRAWGADPALDVDAVVRKGKNEQGQDAFLVQADPARAAALMSGYPTTKAALFGYDAIVFGNVEWDFLTRDQLGMTAEFVRERGGGVLVFGARSFASQGLAGTALEDALPLAVASGRSPVALTAAGAVGANSGTTGRDGGDNKLRLTGEGRDHAIMRVAPLPEDNDRQWSALPPLAAVNLLGAPRPGASVLAVADVNGSPRPVVAVQRYGRGRTLQFAGEGAWRWKMLMPAPDRTHEMFWRQAIRWLAVEAPDPVTLVPAERPQPGTTTALDVLAADSDYHPAANAVVTVKTTAPDGRAIVTNATLVDPAAGRYSAPVKFDEAGVYQVEASARQGAQVLGTTSSALLAGGTDPEFADPRLNDAVLQRLSAQTGGRYLPASDVSALPDLVKKSAESVTATGQTRDLWQHPVVFAAIATLLGAEWVLRRRRGLA